MRGSLRTLVQVLRRPKRRAPGGKVWSLGAGDVQLVISQYHITLTTGSLNSSKIVIWSKLGRKSFSFSYSRPFSSSKSEGRLYGQARVGSHA